MKNPPLLHTITAGPVRLSLFGRRESALRTIMLERSHGPGTAWHPAASFDAADLVLLGQACTEMQSFIDTGRKVTPAPETPPGTSPSANQPVKTTGETAKTAAPPSPRDDAPFAATSTPPAARPATPVSAPAMRSGPRPSVPRRPTTRPPARPPARPKSRPVTKKTPRGQAGGGRAR